MQTHLICYADDQMSISQQLCTKSAKEVGKIDNTYTFGPNSLDPQFRKRCANILETPQRGGGKGFWLWKPYIVEQAIRQLDDGDILIYCDAGVEWTASVNHLIRRMDNYADSTEAEQSVFLFSNGHKHIDWCKFEVLRSMLPDIDTEDSWKQVQASVMLFRVNGYTREFCSRWLAWSSIPGFIDDAIRGPQLPEFREHRNDQSILTNLQIADGIPLHHWPAQYWQEQRLDFPGDKYPQMFYHHRLRNDEWLGVMKKAGMPNGGSINELFTYWMRQPKN